MPQNSNIKKSRVTKGDKVIIVGAAEEETYKGCVFTVTSDPYVICGSEVVQMECPEIGKRFGGGFATEFLKIVERKN